MEEVVIHEEVGCNFGYFPLILNVIILIDIISGVVITWYFAVQ